MPNGGSALRLCVERAVFPILIGALLVVFALMTSCSKPATTSAPAPAPNPTSENAPVKHRVVGTGPRPAPGGSVIIIMEPRSPTAFPDQTVKPSMDQYAQTFTPSLLLVRTGQPVDFLNNDDVLHNVRVRNNATREAAFNVAIPVGEKYVHSFERDGLYEVGCDIHPGMSAAVVSTSTPYATVADSDGRFAFEDVIPGSYVLTVTVSATGRKIQRDVEITSAVTEVKVAEP